MLWRSLKGNKRNWVHNWLSVFLAVSRFMLKCKTLVERAITIGSVVFF